MNKPIIWSPLSEKDFDILKARTTDTIINKLIMPALISRKAGTSRVISWAFSYIVSFVKHDKSRFPALSKLGRDFRADLFSIKLVAH